MADYPLEQVDHDLIHHAKRRGRIMLDNGCECTLIAWRPRTARNRMRVQFDNGKQATVRVTRLSFALIPKEVADAS